MSWRSKKVDDIQSWVYEYVGRRYGNRNLSNNVRTAWQYLLQGAYQYHFRGDMIAIVGRAPQLVMDVDFRLNATQIAAAWQLLMEAVASKELNPSVGPLRYDLVDIGRQVLVNTFVDLHTMYQLAYMKYSTMSFNSSLELTILASAMHDLIIDLDTLLASDSNFLLGTWISDARKSAPSTSPKSVSDNLEFNARNQITMWGPQENINDYASKAWSGLVSDYYGSRWQLLTSMVIAAVESRQQFNQSAYNGARLQLEQKWSYDIKAYPTEPRGDTIQIADLLIRKYYPSADHVSDHFETVSNMDIIGPNVNVFGSSSASGPWSRLRSQVAWLCQVNPTCLGFNSLGLLKNSTDDMQESMGTTLFLKKVHTKLV